MEEGGHLEAIELVEQRRVVEAHPPNRPLLHRLFERGLRHRRPAVRRIVDLNEQVVRRQIGVVDRIRRAEVVDRESFFRGRLLEPALRGVSERLMDRLARFGEGDDRNPGRANDCAFRIDDGDLVGNVPDRRALRLSDSFEPIDNAVAGQNLFVIVSELIGQERRDKS